MAIIEFIFTLLMLVFLQAVLGFDNLLYVSIESKRVAEDRQSYVRRMGIGLAIGFRILLLLLVIFLFKLVGKPFGSLNWSSTWVNEEGTEKVFQWLVAEFTVESVIVLLGGVFIIYTAFKEIFHMLSVVHLGEDENKGKTRRTVGQAITWIVVMNIVFSFDSVLSALALTSNLWAISIAIIGSGLMMIWMADGISAFLQKNRMYEVLGLFILLVVGIMLVSEGAHKANLHFFDHGIHAMEKSTFYFVIIIMVLVDVVQSRYQRKLNIEKEHVGSG